MLNACKISHAVKYCSFLAPVSSWPLHTRIYKHGEKQNMHLFPKAHDVGLCWSNAVREMVIVQCSVSLCGLGCSRSCFESRESVCKESWGQDSRPMVREKSGRGNGRRKKRVDSWEDSQGLVGERNSTEEGAAAYKKIREGLKRGERMSTSKTAFWMSYNSYYETVWEVGKGWILEKQAVN